MMIYLELILIVIIVGFVLKINFSDRNSSNKPETVIDNKTPLIVTYHGEKYNLTEFAKHHPGGKAILYENNGKCIDDVMAVHKHSKHALQLMNKYKLIET